MVLVLYDMLDFENRNYKNSKLVVPLVSKILILICKFKNVLRHQVLKLDIPNFFAEVSRHV